MTDAVLTLNAGSSSLKFSVFDVDSADGSILDERLCGQVEGIGLEPHLTVKDASDRVLDDETFSLALLPSHEACLARVTSRLDTYLGATRLLGVGHRVVHGGVHFDRPVRIDASVLAQLDALVPLAPLHQPHNLSAIRAMSQARPALPQVACFDTAFHRSQSKVADSFGLPAEYYQAGVRRYGFHGLSYESIACRLQTIAPEVAMGRIIVAHLGNGASMCALHRGQSVATTMGFTALDGLPMGTRPGSLDPGVLLHLLHSGRDAHFIEDLLYRQSGLLGLSGLSSDMRVLLASEAPSAQFAIEFFVYRLGREAGSLTAALGGLDAVVFTGGIGEKSPVIRERALATMEWLGPAIDPEANQRGELRISKAGSKVSAWVVPTEEERMIAEHTLSVIRRYESPQVTLH
jgi:acetate kinase